MVAALEEIPPAEAAKRQPITALAEVEAVILIL